MKRVTLNYLIIAALICSAAFTSCKGKGSGDVKLLESMTSDNGETQSETEEADLSILHGKWCYVQTPDTPHEMTYNPPRVEIMPDNTATYFGYEAYWVGTLSKTSENQYCFHVTGEWGEGMYSEMDEEWVFLYNPATGVLTAHGNDFTRE